MSWDSYIDTLKSYSASEAVTEAVIVGKDGCQPWTSLTKNLNVSRVMLWFIHTNYQRVCFILCGCRYHIFNLDSLIIRT